MTTHHLDTRLLHIGAAEFDSETGTAPVSIPAIRTSTVRVKNLEVRDRALTKRAAGERVVTYGIAGLDTHRALEEVFDHRLSIYPLGAQWVALPKVGN